jgi:hypothetical protein
MIDQEFNDWIDHWKELSWLRLAIYLHVIGVIFYISIFILTGISGFFGDVVITAVSLVMFIQIYKRVIETYRSKYSYPNTDLRKDAIFINA